MTSSDGLRRLVSSLVPFAFVACHHGAMRWQALAEQTGCTPELLARAPAYDSASVRSLVGSYRLVQIDTARGWFELTLSSRKSAESRLQLWLVDSVHAHWRRTPLRDSPITVNRPVAGGLAGFEDKGFTADNPQAEIASSALNYLVVQFTPNLSFDVPIWEFPIQRFAPWGFGGYFVQNDYAVPVGRDGKPLGQRAGFYCAFRR